MNEPDAHRLSLAANAQPGARRKGPYLVLLACIVTLYCYNGAALPVLSPGLTGYFGISVMELGLLLAVPTLIGIISYAVTGPACDRWGGKKMLCIAILGIALSFALCGAGTTLAIFAAGVLTNEFFSCVAGVCLPSYVARLYPGSHRRVFSLTLMTMSLSGVITPLVVGRLVTGFPDHFARVLHAPYAILAVLLVVGAILFSRAPSDAPTEGDSVEKRVSLRAGLHLLSRPFMLVILLLATLHATSDAVFSKWFPIYATRQFGDALKHPGDVLMLFGLAYAVSRGALALAPEGWGQRALLIFPGLLGGSTLLACLWANNARLMFWGYPIAGLMWSLEYPTLLSEASRRAPRYLASLLAVMAIVFLPFVAVVTAVVGALIEVMSRPQPTAPWWTHDLRLSMVICPLGFILFGLIAAISGVGRRPKPDQSASQP